MLQIRLPSPQFNLPFQFKPKIGLTDDQLLAFCEVNQELHIERNSTGDLVIMAPAGGDTSWRNLELSSLIRNWAKKDGRGIAFDSSGGFILPNGAMRSPDVAWVSRKQLATLTRQQKKKFLPLAPDFIIELRSPSDRLKPTQDKMEEYMANGVRLGWLVNPPQREVHIYRPNQVIKIITEATIVSGDPELPGLAIDFDEIWEPDF